MSGGAWEYTAAYLVDGDVLEEEVTPQDFGRVAALVGEGL
jgi:hypothetical protein